MKYLVISSLLLILAIIPCFAQGLRSLNEAIDRSYPDFPWHEYEIEIPAPSRVRNVKLAIKQAHPVGSEFIYKVSGKLANGKEFHQPLTTQTGGSPYLTVDYIPNNSSDGFVRFHLAGDIGEKEPDFLDLSSGSLGIVAATNVFSLGFIGEDRRYYKATPWNKLNGLSIMALHNRKFKKAANFAQKELAEARRINDKKLVARSLYDLARSLESGKLASYRKIIKLYKEAKENAEKTVKNPVDFTRIDQGSILFRLYKVYRQQGLLDNARECIDETLSMAAKEKGTESFCKQLKFELVRLALLKNDIDAANKLILLIQPAGNEDMERTWKNLYPYIALLENDIAVHLHSDPAHHALEIAATFEVRPDGEVEKIKVNSTKEFPNLSRLVACTAILGAAPIQTGTPFPIAKTIKLKAKMNYGKTDTSVCITKAN